MSQEVVTLAEASELDVLDSTGHKVRFGSLFETQKTVVVFVRHFFCGSCQDYVAQLATVRRDALEEASTQIVVIGCGEWNPIQFYSEVTGFQGTILADPTCKLYHTLGMTLRTLARAPPGEPTPSYLTKGFTMNVLRSIWRGLVNPSLVGKQGDLSQLGGDFIFGPGQECTFAYRMQHTQDHTEVVDLMRTAGVVYP